MGYYCHIQRDVISADEIATLAEDRCTWRNLVITCSAAEGLYDDDMTGYIRLLRPPF